ncbi:hypothetical protein GCM10007276_06250 [Agaricicola taiwanensis]|uniref:Uncharacterized protein n=1 Tax=Agaricicola taiwanensis TaxID=591372 RepID=A0A8J2VMB4_9RHOB|nr:hypothetical protein [Agaricicola taiwanensis]GGE31806.1 hypothetical protein GCM10007276_06250 [Agaricicola taiwanensis]
MNTEEEVPAALEVPAATKGGAAPVRLPQMQPFVAAVGTSEEATPAVVPLHATDGRLRIRGTPVAGGNAIYAASEEILSQLASLSVNLRELRAEHDPDIAAALRRDMAVVKESVEQLEAFVTITFAAKIDEAINQKLTTARQAQEAHQRVRRWLIGFIGLSAVLMLGFWAEAETGQVIPALRDGITHIAELARNALGRLGR